MPGRIRPVRPGAPRLPGALPSQPLSMQDIQVSRRHHSFRPTGVGRLDPGEMVLTSGLTLVLASPGKCFSSPSTPFPAGISQPSKPLGPSYSCLSRHMAGSVPGWRALEAPGRINTLPDSGPEVFRGDGRRTVMCEQGPCSSTVLELWKRRWLAHSERCGHWTATAS